MHPNSTSPPGKAATEGLDSRCGLVGIEGPEKAAVRLFQRARAKPMDARLWSPTGTPFTTSAIKSFFEQEIYKHPTEWWGAFIWLQGRFSSVTQKSTSRSCWAGKCDCFCDNTGEHDCRLLFFAVEVLIFAGSKTGLTLENGLKVCLTGKSERCGDLTV